MSYASQSSRALWLLQVFLNITVPPELSFLDKTPKGLLSALPQPLANQLQGFLSNTEINASFPGNGTLPDLSNLSNLTTLLAGFIPEELRDSPLGNGLVDFLNNTVGVPVSSHYVLPSSG